MSKHTDKLLVLIASQLQLQNSVLLSGKFNDVDKILDEHKKSVDHMMSVITREVNNEIRTK